MVIGFGKAVVPMAAGLEDQLGGLVDSGVLVTKYGHGQGNRLPERIRLFEAGHPVPDANGEKAAGVIADLLHGLDERTLVLTLISGGGSALFVSPFPPVTLAEKQATTDLLLKAGADIFRLNTVRKHLSRVKGGRLAQAIQPAAGISLILSDVIGDPLDVIASGPTAPDPTSFREALDVLEKYRIQRAVPPKVLELFINGMEGKVPETPKPGNVVFQRITNRIIGGNRTALEAARQKAEEAGLKTVVLPEPISGEAREAGKWLAEKALSLAHQGVGGFPICMISGGETTVTVTGGGKGGRNMELALAFSTEIAGTKGITLLSAGTDGTDGPTDAAGAIVDGRTMEKGLAMGMDPAIFLGRNDSYSYFQRTNELLVTGPTGTNVMDMQLILVDGSAVQAS